MSIPTAQHRLPATRRVHSTDLERGCRRSSAHSRCLCPPEHPVPCQRSQGGGGEGAKMRSPVIKWCCSRNLLDSKTGVVRCYDCPTRQCSSPNALARATQGGCCHSVPPPPLFFASLCKADPERGGTPLCGKLHFIHPPNGTWPTGAPASERSRTDTITNTETMGDQPGAKSCLQTQALPKSVLEMSLPSRPWH